MLLATNIHHSYRLKEYKNSVVQYSDNSAGAVFHSSSSCVGGAIYNGSQSKNVNLNGAIKGT